MKLNKRLKKLVEKIDNLEAEVKSIKKIVNKPTTNQPVIINNIVPGNTTITPPKRDCRLKDFYCGPDKAADHSSTVNALVKNFGINQNGIMTFKTGYISSKFSTFYNGRDLSLSVTNDHVILHINRLKVRAWSLNRILKKLQDKNPDSCINKCQLIEMIKNGDAKLRFNVSAIKDHGTYWKIN
jgi:hypothetical protein